MMNDDERYKKACEKFLAQHPEIKAEIDALSAEEADILAQSLDEFRGWKLNERLTEYAGYAGIDPAELVINLAARDESERRSMLLDHHRKIAEQLGMDWEEYCELNPHIKKLED